MTILLENEDVVDIVSVSGDDWCVLYVNGVDYFQGHSLPDRDIFDAVRGKYVRTLKHGYIETTAGQEYLEDWGRFPDLIEDLFNNEKNFGIMWE